MNHTKKHIAMGMGTHLVLCTRHSIFYRKQHLRDDVY